MDTKKIISYLISFIVPIILFLLVMYLRIGEIDGNYILIADMGSQYNSLFQYLKNVLNGSESLFYSFHKGLGGEMFTTFAYYLSSPLNLLVVLFKDGQIPNCILTIILIKLGLCGLNMNIYLTHKFSCNLKINFVFSMCYALMSYTVNYYFNIMWLDAVYMLPIVILGLERLIDKQKPLLYIIALSYTIICNYYMGYMVCIFVLIYYIYQMIIKDKRDKKVILIFIVSSILSAGMASFILIPTIIQMGKFSGTYGLDVKTSELIIGFFKNIFNSTHSFEDVSNATGTYTYTSVVCLFLTILFINNKTIPKKEKIAVLVLILMFLVSFIFNPLRYIWHGFTYPNFLNNRHSFLFCFFIITLSVKSLDRLYFDKKNFCIVLIVYIIICYMLIFILEFSNLNSIILSICILSIEIILLYNIRKNRIFNYLFYSCIIFEIFFNAYNSFLSKTIISESYQDYNHDICKLIVKNIPDNNLRVESNININEIEGLTCGYSNTSVFLSTLTKDDRNFYYKTGYTTTGKRYFNNLNNNGIFDSFLGIKYYILEEGSVKDNLELKQTDSCVNIGKYNNDEQDVQYKKYCLYESKIDTSLLNLVDDIEIKYTENVFDNQNKILKSYLNQDKDLINNLEVIKEKENIYRVYNYGKPFYMYIKSDKFKSFNDRNENNYELWPVIYANNEIVNENIDKNTHINSVLFINSPTESTEINIKKINSTIDDVYASAINPIIGNYSFDMLTSDIEIRNNYIKGTIWSKKSGYLLIKFPYDDKFILYIDGKIVNTEKAFDYFIAVKIDKGQHDIKLIYDKSIYYYSMSLSVVFCFISVFFSKKIVLKF